MSKKQSSLKVVTGEVSQEDQRKWVDEHKPWDEAEQGWRITAREMRQRVRTLRDELEAYQQQLEAMPFDIPTGDHETPRCLDGLKRKYHVQLVEQFNPLVPGLFDMIDDYAKKHGCHEHLDFNSKIYQLKSECFSAGFKIGVLAGAIFAGCPKEYIDRLERGLAFAVCRDQWANEKD